MIITRSQLTQGDAAEWFPRLSSLHNFFWGSIVAKSVSVAKSEVDREKLAQVMHFCEPDLLHISSQIILTKDSAKGQLKQWVSGWIIAVCITFLEALLQQLQSLPTLSSHILQGSSCQLPEETELCPWL
jgi:hypothetical protein